MTQQLLEAWEDYWKLHGLGNDYLVIHPKRFQPELTPKTIAAICNYHTGVGSNGVLLGPLRGVLASAAGFAAPSPTRDAPLGDLDIRIYNPDGSEAEKSGNGLRIFACYAWQHGLAPKTEPFWIQTLGGKVRAQVLNAQGTQFKIDMGQARFAHQQPTEELCIQGETLHVCPVNLGNPHCVITNKAPSPQSTVDMGPLVENHVRFPQGVNVQWLQVQDKHAIYIEIWERGAGRTLASGSSACAAAAAAVRLGFCQSPLQVNMPGGGLQVTVHPNFELTQQGLVSMIAQGRFNDQWLQNLHLQRTPPPAKNF